ncbi:type II toxin-antitoxin system HicA family toxin [Aphanizomenon sp. PH219]|nr:type II toxin-antitoxin system HicA family toxin [Aphanizomenon sp. PH219]
MAKSFTPELKKILDGAGCYFERSGKGDHEIWYSPLTQRRFVVDQSIKSRHTKKIREFGSPVTKRAGWKNDTSRFICIQN